MKCGKSKEGVEGGFTLRFLLIKFLVILVVSMILLC
jgi:hypothetical protein